MTKLSHYSHCMYFFFFKQKTAYEMRISDWSSDVCSSDLQAEQLLGLTPCQLVEPDFSRKDGTDDELCATMRVEQLACLGHVAIDGARGQRQRAGNMLVREAAPGKDDAVSWARVHPRSRHRRSDDRRVGTGCVT